MSINESILVPTDDLKVGSVTKHAIIDTESALLLAGGIKITERIKQRLKKRGIDSVFLHPDDVESASNALQSVSKRRENLDQSPAEKPKNNVPCKVDALASKISCSVDNSGQAVRERAKFPGAVPYNPSQRRRLIETFNTNVLLLTNMISKVVNGGRQGATELASMATNYVDELSEDSGHVVSMADDMAQSVDMSPRTVRMSILAMAIAIELGFDEDNVRTVGISALVHDWGLFLLDEKLRDSNQPLSENDWLEYEKHPIKSVDLLEGMEGISGVVRLASYQVHERLDGSGFPKGRKADVIHIFARIIAVADSYISLGSQVRGRPALIPYDALVCLMHQANQRKLDGEVVRALLRTLSIFPIGSHLLLNDGSEAKVLRSNREDYTKPVVQKLADENGIRIDAAHEEMIVNLAKSPLTPVRPLATPGRREIRIERELLDEITWDGPGS